MHRSIAPLALSALLTLTAAPVLAQVPWADATETSETFPADGLFGDQFGYALAIDGDYAAVGARFDDSAASGAGSVYVLERNLGGADAWGIARELVAATTTISDQLGTAVALDAGLVLGGAPFYDPSIPSQTDVGAALVFDAATGVQLNVLVPSTFSKTMNFGSAVALEGSAALIGAPGYDVPGSYVDGGIAFLMDALSGATLQTLSPPVVASSDDFGRAVALGGGRALVGAPGAGADGAVYVFDATTGALTTTLTPPDGTGNDRFGAALALQGDLLAIGAPLQPAIYVYDLGTGLLVNKLTPEPTIHSGFGASVALDGAWLYASDLSSGSFPAPWCGRVHQLDWAQGYTVAIHRWSGAAAFCGEGFGQAVAAQAGTVLAGGPSGDGAAVDSGTAWLLEAVPLALGASKASMFSFEPLTLNLRGGAPGLPAGVGLFAVNGTPVVPLLILGLGAFGADGQAAFSFPSTGPISGVTLTFLAAGVVPSGLLEFTNTVDVIVF